MYACIDMYEISFVMKKDSLSLKYSLTISVCSKNLGYVWFQ